MNNIIYDDIAIIIPTYHTYFDMLDIFLYLWYKHWPKCPFKLIVSTTKSYECEYDNVDVYLNDINDKMCRRIYNPIKEYKYSHYIVILEDCLMFRDVQEDKIFKLINNYKSLNLNYCKLLENKMVKDSKYTGLGKLSYINKKEVYGMTLMAFMCSKKYILENFNSDDSGWDWEQRELKLADDAENGYYEDRAINQENTFQLIHSVAQGKWLYGAKNILSQTNKEIVFTNRECFTSIEQNIRDLKIYVFLRLPICIKKSLHIGIYNKKIKE